ncbi:MAG: Gfo/Idh/MocA family oxidoreductase [Spirochaetales bacterium]|nr:Gfo/Idh/MocA family oxidoreductase [Spirochaetales bacterium]
MKTIRWGVIGCGDISRKRVVPAINALEECELTAVARQDASLAESFAGEFGAKRWYGSWKDLIEDSEIDAVYISTPVYLHAEQTIAAAEAGKHVLCEKPMGLNTDECGKMLDACRANGVTFGTAYYRHFYPLVNRIKELILSGEIGDPVTADVQACEWFDRKPGEPRAWLLNKKMAGGGPMMDFGCHRIEVLLDLFGPVRSLNSEIFNLHFTGREVEDTALLSLLFENSVHSTLRVSHAVMEGRDTLDIFGTRGSLHVPVLNGEILIVKNTEGERSEHHPPHVNVHQPLIEDFTRALLEKREPVINGETGRTVNQILDRIYSPLA